MKARPSSLDPHKADLEKWFAEEKITYDVARTRLAECGCEVSRSQVAKWWGQRMEELQREAVLASIASGAAACREIRKKFAAAPAPELETIMGLLQTLTMNVAVKAQADPELWRPMLQMVDRLMAFVGSKQDAARTQIARDQVELAQRRVQLLEEQAAKAKAQLGQVVSRGGLSDETIRKIEEACKLL